MTTQDSKQPEYFYQLPDEEKEILIRFRLIPEEKKNEIIQKILESNK